MITGVDQFLLWDNEYHNNFQGYVISETDGAASVFFNDGAIYYSMMHDCLFGFCKKRWLESEGRSEEYRPTKQDIAIELLLHHPTWSDEKIAAEVPTTMKQLKRMSSYKAIRVCQDHVKKGYA